jgi:hypothetical protein
LERGRSHKAGGRRVDKCPGKEGKKEKKRWVDWEWNPGHNI